VNRDDVLFIGRVVSDYFTNTTNGKHTALMLLKATKAPVSALKSYYPKGHFGNENKRINPKDLTEYRGYIYRGQHAVAFDSIEIDEREDSNICDACGGKFPVYYCMQKVQVLKTGSIRDELWCNHCRSSSESPKIRDTASPNTCMNCEKRACDFHPKNPSNVKLLPAPQRSTHDPFVSSPW
jgi:hypothetical protein